MKYPLVFCRLPAALLLSALLLGAAAQGVRALPFSADLLWSGTGEGDTAGELSLLNRGDLRLHALGLTLRGQVIDKRPLPPGENTGEALTAPGAALYHDASGSRFLYRIISETGLAPRLRNPAIRAVPFFENHPPSGADLKTEPSSTGKAGFYLNLTSPFLGPVGGFASVSLDAGLDGGSRWGGGLRFRFSPRINLGLEGLYMGSALPPRTPTTWFSADPSLPERDHRLYGFHAAFTAPFVGIASDLAFSQTFAFGRDLYGNLGITIGDRPWRLSLAADVAGARFVGSDGSGRGALFRSAGRFEWRGRRSSLFRISTSLRSSGPGEPFTRSSSLASYRFPTPSRESFLALSRLSLTAARDASDPEEVADRLDASLGLLLGPLRSTLQGSLQGLSAGSPPGGAAESPGPYPFLSGDRRFEALRASGELSYAFSPFQVRAKIGFSIEEGKENRWDLSFSGSLRGKLGRISLKVGAEELGGPWAYTVSWRLNHRFAF